MGNVKPTFTSCISIMQFKPITAIIVLSLVLASMLVAGCIVSPTGTSSPTPTPTVQATVAATATPAATVKATATPTAKATATATPSSDYTSGFNTYGNRMLGEGFITTSSFQKSNLNGRDVYVGTLQKNGQPYHVQFYPMSSYSAALSFKEQLISSYKSQGYTTYTSSTSTSDSDMWLGNSGYTLVGVGATETTLLDTPITMVMTATVT